MLRYFLEKVSNVAISRFLGNTYGNFGLLGGIFWHILQLYVTIWPFCTFFGVSWAFYAVLPRIKFCRNLRTFSGKIILAPNLLV